MISSLLVEFCYVTGICFSAVLKVTVKEESGSYVSVTVRLYGPNTDYVINRDRELQVTCHAF